MRCMKYCLIGLTLSTWIITGSAEPVPFDSERWEFHDGEHRVEQYAGQQSLYLKGSKAFLSDVEFTNGIIEYDVLFPSELTTLKDPRSFVSGILRLQDTSNFEKFYMRPHRTPADEDGAQYVPEYNNWSSWQLFWENHIAPVKFVHDTWTHVKLMFANTQLEVYFGDMETPLLRTELKREVKPGKVGVKVDPEPPTAFAYFANFSYEITDTPPFKQPPLTINDAPAGTVMKWQVSDPFVEAEVKDKLELRESDRSQRTWQSLDADKNTGITNLAMLYGITPQGGGDGKNTVFARTVIQSDTNQLKELQFGYTDIGRLYLNGRLMYNESNLFRSRNKTFMGNVGYFNKIYLPLKPGANELWFAVTGLMASWGLKAKLTDFTKVAFSTDQTGNLEAVDGPAGCMASYSLDGKVHIPCIAVPNGDSPAAGVTVFQVDMIQRGLQNYNFDLDLDSIRPRNEEPLTPINSHQYLMISRFAKGTTQEQTAPYSEEEAAMAWKYYQEGLYRLMWGRTDQPGVIVIMESNSEAEAREAVNAMPLVAKGLVEYDIVPLDYFFPLDALFSSK